MAGKSTNSGQKYWYKISVETARVWTFLVVLAVVGTLGVLGFGTVRRHFLSKQVESAMSESRDLMERLSSEEDLFNYRNEWASARASLEQARLDLLEGEVSEALANAQRSRALLLSIHEGLLKRTGGEAQFIAVHGQVEYRRGERGEWINARTLTALYEGDYIKTSGNGSAEVMTAEGVLFTVRPDSVILVSSSRSESGAKREQTIALESGWVNLSTSQTGSRIKTPGAEARVEERSTASVAYDEATRTSSFAAFNGSLEVTDNRGETRRVNELERVVQTPGSLSAAQKLPEAPALLEPANNLEISLAARDEVILVWEPVANASRYALQVSTNKLFVDNVIDVENRKRPRARLGLRGEGTFVWRVAALDPTGAMGPWSLYNRFRVISGQPPDDPGAL